MAKRVDIAKRLEELDCDPVEGMVRIAMRAEENNNDKLASHIYGELLQYTAPKLKSMEHSIEPETMQFLNRQQRLARIQELARQVKLPLSENEEVIDAEYHIPDEP